MGLSAPRLYDSLERGVIAGLFIANSGLSSFNLYDVLDSGVECKCYVAARCLAMNPDKWNSLSDIQRAAIGEVGPGAVDGSGGRVRRSPRLRSR